MPGHEARDDLAVETVVDRGEELLGPRVEPDEVVIDLVDDAPGCGARAEVEPIEG